MTDTNEIGRELTVWDLTPRTVYVLTKPGRPAITLWFVARTDSTAHFYGGKITTNLLLGIQPDGSLQDDSGTEIKVYKYTGQV